MNSSRAAMLIADPVVKNAIANYAGAAALIAVPIATLPVYVNSLGEEQWALVGFVLMLQALLGLVDAGVSQVLVREFSKHFSIGTSVGSFAAARLLKACERAYWCVGAAIALIAVFASWPLASHWLNLSPHSELSGRLAVMGAGALCMLQLPGMLYRGVAIAAQAQVTLNWILTAGVILRYVGGAIAVTLSPSLITYLLWHLVSMAVETYARSRLAWLVVGGPAHTGMARFRELRDLIGSMSTWTLASTIGAVTVQTDKIVLTALQPINELANYFIAAQLAGGALQLFYPIITAILPRIIGSPASRKLRSVRNLKLAGLFLGMSLVILVVAHSIGADVLAYWLNEQRAIRILPILEILLIGISCNAVSTVGYMNWLAGDKRIRLLSANAAAFVVVVVLANLLVPRMGQRGAAVAWSAGQALVLIISLDWVLDAFKRR